MFFAMSFLFQPSARPFFLYYFLLPTMNYDVGFRLSRVFRRNLISYLISLTRPLTLTLTLPLTRPPSLSASRFSPISPSK